MHLIADRVEKKVGLPVIHIATATATEIKKQDLKKVALLGTKFTMELDFFRSRWGEKIYNNINSSIGWDGYKDGQLCKDDVYTYKILVTNLYNAQKEYVGHVTLVR